MAKGYPEAVGKLGNLSIHLSVFGFKHIVNLVSTSAR